MQLIERLARKIRIRRLIRENLAGISYALIAVILTTLFVGALSIYFPFDHGSPIFLIPVLLAATRWGMVAAVTAAVAAELAAMFFFYEPLYSFYVRDPEEIIDLIRFIVVAIVTSHLATNLKQQLKIARKREQQFRDLNEFSRKLTLAYSPADIYAAIQDHLSTVLRCPVYLIGAGHEAPSGSSEAPPERIRQAAIERLGGEDKPKEATVIDPLTRHVWLLRAVAPNISEFGVLAIDLGNEPSDAVDVISRGVDPVIADALLTLERLDLGRALSEARMRSEADMLRDALIGSVSHELRTPLASILGAATIITKMSAENQNRRIHELSTVISEEAERLNSDIQNLLDAARITNNRLQPHLECVDPSDIANAAIQRKHRQLASHKVELEVASDLPLINVDPVLMEQALGQVLDNAAKYSPLSSTIKLSARANRDRLLFSVADAGSGIVRAEQNQIWERFFRGQRHAAEITGSGLGLWIARAFVTANSGTIEATSSGPDLGSTFLISLPVAKISDQGIEADR
jgi:two-component system sensor histidine kinase KdpD